MPYRGSSYRGRGRYRKAGYYGRYRKRYSRGGGVVVERKFFDDTTTVSPIPTSGVMTGNNMIRIPSMTSGSVGESSRNGRKVVVTKVSMRVVVKWSHENTSATGLDQYNKCRIMLGIDKQCNGVNPTSGDIFDSGSITLNEAFNNLSNKGRFITLFDKFLLFNNQYSDATGTNNKIVIKRFNYNKKCRIPILYDSTLGAVTERCCNNLFLYCISNISDVSTPDINNITVDFYHRVRFMDV